MDTKEIIKLFGEFDASSDLLYVKDGELKKFEAKGCCGGWFDRLVFWIRGYFNKETVANKIFEIFQQKQTELKENTPDMVQNSSMLFEKLRAMKERFAHSATDSLQARQTLLKAQQCLLFEGEEFIARLDFLQRQRESARRVDHREFFQIQRPLLLKEFDLEEANLRLLERDLERFNGRSEKDALAAWKKYALNCASDRNRARFETVLLPQLRLKEPSLLASDLPPDLFLKHPKIKAFDKAVESWAAQRLALRNQEQAQGDIAAFYHKVKVIGSGVPLYLFYEPVRRSEIERALLQTVLSDLLDVYGLKEDDVAAVAGGQLTLCQFGEAVNREILEGLYRKHESSIQQELVERRRESSPAECRKVFDEAVEKMAKRLQLDLQDVKAGKAALMPFAEQDFLASLKDAMPIKNYFKMAQEKLCRSEALDVPAPSQQGQPEEFFAAVGVKQQIAFPADATQQTKNLLLLQASLGELCGALDLDIEKIAYKPLAKEARSYQELAAGLNRLLFKELLSAMDPKIAEHLKEKGSRSRAVLHSKIFWEAVGKLAGKQGVDQEELRAGKISPLALFNIEQLRGVVRRWCFPPGHGENPLLDLD